MGVSEYHNYVKCYPLANQLSWKWQHFVWNNFDSAAAMSDANLLAMRIQVNANLSQIHILRSFKMLPYTIIFSCNLCRYLNKMLSNCANSFAKELRQWVQAAREQPFGTIHPQSYTWTESTHILPSPCKHQWCRWEAVASALPSQAGQEFLLLGFHHRASHQMS